MLGSITPLGERGRGRNFSTTIVALTAGSMLGGATCAIALWILIHYASTASGVSLSDRDRLGALGILCVVAGMVDTGLRIPIPRPTRQVNRGWLTTYRGWVYGVGFGVQLGMGFVTIVSTAATYVVFVGASIAPSALAAGTVGSVYGLTRASMAWPGARVTTWDNWRKIEAFLAKYERAADNAIVAVESSVGILALALVCLSVMTI